jgi:UDP-glucuronate decarboxylase
MPATSSPARRATSPNRHGRAFGNDRPVLVAGGAGFIGSHLCERLLREGFPVICLDNFSTSDPDNIVHLRANRSFKVIRGDVAKLRLGAYGKVGAIFNLACPASPVRYQRQPLDTLFTCVHGMHNLLHLARRDGAPIFQASTSEIYGHPQVHPQLESYWGYVNTMGPRACYDEGKRCAETLCFIYQQQYGIPVRVARIFNTYGPRMHMSDGRVIVNLISQALRNQPLTVFGDGTQTRSFCYVDDLVEAILRMMGAEMTYAGPINLGNPTEITILALAQRIIAATRSTSHIVTRPLPVDDPPRRRPNIDLAVDRLKWQPRTDLDAGLMLTIRYFEQRLLEERDITPLIPERQRAAAAGSVGADAI